MNATFILGGIVMNTTLAVWLVATAFADAHLEQNPPVLAKMEQMGTLYVTRQEPVRPNQKLPPGSVLKKNAILGIDFRPTAGTDPKKVAEVVRELSTLPDLQFVLLVGQPINDEVVASLPATPKLINVRFFNTKVTDQGVANLTRFTRLQVFGYTGTELTDNGLVSLARIRSLNTITITDAKISDKGVLSLHTLVNLRRFTIENSAATEQAVQTLRESLPRLNNPIRDFG
jgi:hypothetical protein